MAALHAKRQGPKDTTNMNDNKEGNLVEKLKNMYSAQPLFKIFHHCSREHFHQCVRVIMVVWPVLAIY